MAEQQLVDYITKAKEANQSDEQTRSLLYKSGWTEAEVNDAFAASVQPSAQAQPETSTVVQPSVVNAAVADASVAVAQPVVDAQPQVVINQSQPEIKTQSEPQTQPQIQPQVQTEIKIQPQVQQQPAAVVAQDSYTQTMKPKSHILSKILIVLVILIVVGGAGYLVAAQYLNFLWNPFRPSPETVISRMTSNMKNVKYYHSSLQIEADATDSSSKALQGKILLTADADQNLTDAQNPQTNSNLTLKLSVPELTSPIVSLDANAISAANAVSYVKVNNITLPNGVSYPGLNVSQINGRWFKIDKDSYKAISQVENSQSGSAGVTQADTSDLAKKIQDLVITENMISVSKQLDDQVIDGQDTYHYAAVITKDKIKDLITKILALESQEAAKLQPQGGSSDSSVALVQSMIQSLVGSVVDSVGDVNMEMWIGKKDYLLYGVKMDKTIDLSKILGALGITTNVELKVDLKDSNFNKVVAIQAPTDTQKIEDIILPMLKIRQISSDLTKIGQDAQMLEFDAKSYPTLCIKGLLNGYQANYGKDLISINDDIIANGGGKLSCFASAKSYCISTQLLDGSYSCVDANGTGTEKCTSSATACSEVPVSN